MGLFSKRKAQTASKETNFNPGSIKSSDPGLSDYVLSRISGIASNGFVMSSSMAYQLYERSDAVGNAIDKIAWAFQGISPVLKNTKTGELLSKPEDHPLLKLLSLPSIDQSREEFFFSLMVSFCATGNAFPLVSGNVKYEPAGIKSIPASRANLIQTGESTLGRIYFNSSDNQNVYYRQVIPKRRMAVYQADNQLSETAQLVINKRRDGIDAQSPLERVYYQAMTKIYGTRHNMGITKNGSRPGGIFSPEGNSVLDQDQYEQFIQEVRGNFSGDLAGRDIVAPTGIKYENLFLNTRDMDFIQLISVSKADIYTAFDIPLPLISEATMTMGNFENAMIAFFDSAVTPRAGFLFAALGRLLLPRYKDGDLYELTYDEKALPAVKSRMFDRAKKMREISAFSENEIRTETGYEATSEGDTIWKPAMLVNTQETDDYTDDNIQVEENDA